MAFEDLNEKLKNLGKKKPETGAKKQSELGEFFRKNSFLKYVIPIAIFLVVIGVFLAVTMLGDTLSEEEETMPSNIISSGDQTVAVLPNDQNVVGTTDSDLEALIERDPLSEDILAKAEYKGCVSYSNGYKVAIVNNGGIDYELTVGDCLGDSSWQVTEISDSSITFSAGTQQKTLKQAG